MSKEFRVDYEKIKDPQTITKVNQELFKEHDVETTRHEVKEIVDDNDKRQRIYKIKNPKYFGPWSHRG